jgi:transposase
MRAHLAEFGLVAQKGREGLQQLIRTVAEADDERLPSDACLACQAIIAQLQAVQIQITRLDKRILRLIASIRRASDWKRSQALA